MIIDECDDDIMIIDEADDDMVIDDTDDTDEADDEHFFLNITMIEKKNL